MREGDNILLFHPATAPRGKLSPSQGDGSGPWRHKHAGKFQEAHVVLPVLLSVFSMRVLTVTLPRPVMYAFNPFVLVQVLGSCLSAQPEGTGTGEASMLGPVLLAPHLLVKPAVRRRKLPSTHKQKHAKKCILFLWSGWRTSRKYCFYLRAPDDGGATWEWMG